MKRVEVGDEVIVTGRFICGGRPTRARVCSVRRAYFGVEVPGRREPVDFRIDGGLERDRSSGYSNYLAVARTPEQQAQYDALVEANEVFKTWGIQFSLGRRKLSDDQCLDLADFLRSWGEPDG